MAPESGAEGRSGAAGRLRVIVAGCGTLGIHAVREIRRLGGIETVVIERDADRAEQVAQEFGEDATVVAGDSLDEHLLLEVGVQTADGLIGALRRDRDNLFLCLTARQINPGLRVISRVESTVNSGKFRTVGVSAVVSPATRGGRRLAHAVLRPEISAFADALVDSEDRPRLIRVLVVEPGAPVARLRLVDADIHGRTGCVVLGVRQGARGRFRYRPSPLTRLRPGRSIAALGEEHELEALRVLMTAPPDPAGGAGSRRGSAPEAAARRGS